MKQSAKIFIAITLFIFVGLGWLFIFYSSNEVTTEPSEEPIRFTSLTDESIQSTSETASSEEARIAVSLQHQAFLERSAGEYGWITFVQDSQPVAFETGASALDISIPNDLSGLLNQSDWGIYSCEVPAGSQPGYVLRIKNQILPNYSGDLYQDTLDRLRNWEGQMFLDTQSVLFPETPELSTWQASSFATVDAYFPLRATQILDGQAKVGELAYGFLGDYILIGNSAECVQLEAQYLVEYVP